MHTLYQSDFFNFPYFQVSPIFDLIIPIRILNKSHDFVSENAIFNFENSNREDGIRQDKDGQQRLYFMMHRNYLNNILLLNYTYYTDSICRCIYFFIVDASNHTSMHHLCRCIYFLQYIHRYINVSTMPIHHICRCVYFL